MQRNLKWTSMPFLTLAAAGLVGFLGMGTPAEVQADRAVSVSEAADAAKSCEEGAGEEVAKRIQSRYEDIQDLTAAFTQASDSATFGGQALMDADTKSGRVIFAKPGKMRWVYEKPEPSVVVSDGATLWIHDVAGRSVTRLAVTRGFLSGAAFQFLLGEGRILESFDVEATDCSEERISLDLLPKADATYERLGLVADPRTGDVLATSVADLFGNVTRIEFSGTRVNLSPPAGEFDFEVPEGVELIEYEGAPGS